MLRMRLEESLTISSTAPPSTRLRNWVASVSKTDFRAILWGKVGLGGKFKFLYGFLLL